MERSWKDLQFWESETWKDIKRRLETEPHLPSKKNIFRALMLTRLQDTKCLILGQDPYPTPGYANGLAFSVSPGYLGKLPRSLNNVYKELTSDVGCPWPANGDLSRWSKQGVLLLNTCLTVAPNEALSHRDWGWQELVKEVILMLSEDRPFSVFVLWGERAQNLAQGYGNPKVESAHPSPLSATLGFFGSRPFTKVNSLLSLSSQTTIDWR